MKFTDLALSQAITGIAECAAVALEDTVNGRPQRVVTTFGEVVWDWCDCPDGQLAVAATQPFYASDSFPTQVQTRSDSNCGPNYVVIPLQVAVTRCVPRLQDDGQPPTPTDLRNALFFALADAVAVRRSVICCLRTMYENVEIADYQIGATAWLGPLGGCGGSTLPFFIGYTNDTCC